MKTWIIAKDFLALTKPRVVLMVLITTFVGFYFASDGTPDWLIFFNTIIGGSLAAGGTMALNQFLERDLDARMKRTQNRPLPAGRLRPAHALIFGLTIVVGGILYLVVVVNFLSGLITSFIVVGYLWAYTPLKLKTSLSSVVGAIPGALPPVVGWVAVQGRLSHESLVLFGILFFWQMPHLFALAWLYRDDYARAGFRILPVIHPDGRSTAWQSLINCHSLLLVSMIPTFMGMAGGIYFFAALLLGMVYLIYAIGFVISRSKKSAKKLLLASYGYLPLLIGMMILDKVG